MPDTRLPTVSYRFSSTGTHGVQWHIRRFRLQEALSEPYHLELEMWTEDNYVHPTNLLGDTCTLTIEHGDGERAVHGVIHHVDMLPMSFGRVRLRVVVVPALYLLRYHVNTRFWTDRTALQILEEVLRPALVAYGRKIEAKCDSRPFMAREYCVQYRETDLEFVTRLMNEEGIVYCFKHAQGDVERLVLYDSITRAEDIGVQKIQFVPPGNGVHTMQSVESLDWSCRLGTTSVVQRDWAWKVQGRDSQVDPPTSYYHERRGVDDRDRDRERYDHDDRLVGQDDGAARARNKLAAESHAAQSGHGVGDVVEMTPGRYFELQSHPVPEREGRYLLLSVSHVGDVPEMLSGGRQDSEGPRYRNEFRCIPSGVPYFGPPVPPRRRVHGPQTAIVVGVGPDDKDDIHTDEHGRIRVIFHWDRLSPHDETASCWVRVAQTWAGPRWGHQFIPRVGMEVLVEFLDGDPDRPLVVGCVYNGLNRPPYSLPEKKTQSGIKTDSSPGGGGSNELRFEDAKGREEVWIHAQKDLNERVEHNHSASVGADQINTVGGAQTETIGGQQKLTVEKNRVVSITGSQSVTIKGATPAEGVSGSRLDITGDYVVDASRKIEVEAPTHIMLTCGRSSILIEPDKITLTAGGQAKLVLDANVLLMASGGANVQLDADVLANSYEGAALLLDASVVARARDGAELLLNADATVTSKACSQMKLDDGAVIHGVSSAAINAPRVTLDGGGSTIDAGEGTMHIKAAMIKHN